MIGVPIPNYDDPDANQDHYVCFIYENDKKVTLFRFIDYKKL